MTHTNHRQGTREDLSHDFVVMIMGARGVNTEGGVEKTRRFFDMAKKYHPVNAGHSRKGNLFSIGTMDGIVEAVQTRAIGCLVFATEEDLTGFLTELHQADLGLSVIVTGLLDRARECAGKAGAARHTVEYSLGIFGKTERLADPTVMQLTTMCGHAQVSFNLVSRVVKDVARGVITLDEAVATVAKPCVCGIVNSVRARRLIEKLVAASVQPVLGKYIAIDPSKCDQCYACEVSCIESHPKNGGLSMCTVDGTVPPALSLHCLHCGSAPCLQACATGNIVRDGAYDVVYMRGDRCVGCKLCVSACPFGMIVWDSQAGQARKCSLCLGRLREGKAPACVAGCPTGSLTLAQPAEVQQAKHRTLHAALSAHLGEAAGG